MPDFQSSVVYTFQVSEKKNDYPAPELIDMTEDLPTIGNVVAMNNGRVVRDDNGNIVDFVPLELKDKNDPNYIKLPTTKNFGIATLDPATQALYWAIVAHNADRFIVRLSYPMDPLQGVDTTRSDFSIRDTVPGNDARKVAARVHDLPAMEPDTHDNWAIRLFSGLYDENATSESEDEDND